MRIQLTKIPSVVRRLGLGPEVDISEMISPEEGAVIVVEALEDQGTNNVLDFASGRLGRLVEGDIIPGALGKRRALREYSGDIPTSLKPGDVLYLTCESAVFGEIKGMNEAWGKPMQVRVLGSVVREGKQLNIRDAAVEWQDKLETSAPIVAVVGTCMDVGKTTAICKLVRYFKRKGLKVAAAKLAGVAFSQDPLKITDAGANPVLDFVDGGLPSTCGDLDNVIRAALGVLKQINESAPDLIIAEFGDGIIGEYNVEHMLRHPDIQKHIRATIVAAGDIVAAWGAREIMNQYGLPITLITGPAVNNETGATFVEKRLGIPAESNLHQMPKTWGLVEEKILGYAPSPLNLESAMAPVCFSPGFSLSSLVTVSSATQG